MRSANRWKCGSGCDFQTFDRNGDGTISNGRERFGPTSGNGFQELTARDGDQNGWIDENDAASNPLTLWTPDKTDKGTLPSLSTTGLGAFAPSRMATPFALKTNANQLLGHIRTSGIFLHEAGTTGTIYQIDLTA